MRRLTVAACVALALGLAGCKGCSNQTEAPVYLRITLVEGSPGGFDDTFGTYMHSDVLWQDPKGEKPDTVYADMARLTVQAIPKNPDYAADWGGVNPGLQDVRLERYEVVYTRGDGRNVAGVDVPFPINGPMAAIVPFDGEAEAIIEVVRHAAKEEPPLQNLIVGNNDGLFTVIATITVHGRTGPGAVVEASGMLQITFANFGNGD